MLEALREGGPRKRDGGGGRFGLIVGVWRGEELGETARGEDDIVWRMNERLSVVGKECCYFIRNILISASLALAQVSSIAVS